MQTGVAWSAQLKQGNRAQSDAARRPLAQRPEAPQIELGLASRRRSRHPSRSSRPSRALPLITARRKSIEGQWSAPCPRPAQ